jgi:membrane-bound lytic murein transglycosylase B
MLIVAAALAAFVAPAVAQDEPTQIVTIYRAAPGQQVELLKWLAAQEQASQKAGVGRSQLYAHLNGASWDYLVIGPITTPEQDKAVDAAATKAGQPAGMKAGLAMRQFIAEHSDTMVTGPTSAAALLKSLGQ